MPLTAARTALRRDQPGASVRRRADQWARHTGAHRRRGPVLDADRLSGHGPRRVHRHIHGRHLGLLRRMGGRGDRPGDGRVPRLPAAGVRDRPGRGRALLGRVGMSGNMLRVALLIFIIGFFAWPYIGRIIRGQAISLREREFVDAARSLGARTPYIMFRELLPNLVAPILVYSTLLIPTNILFEAYLDYLGVGLIPPTPSWGSMLSDAVTNSFWSIDPMFIVIPGLAIFLTVMAFNMFGDGLRDALDPRTR